VATTAVILFIWQARPEIFASTTPVKQVKPFSIKPVILGLLAVTVLTGGVFSWFASSHPDGLEWAMFKISGKKELETPEHSIYSSLATLQEKTAVLPDYTFKKSDAPSEEGEESWPAVDQGTSFSGLIGGAIVFLIAMGIGFGLRRKQRLQ
jgi:cobalt/nickel transport system permease protein